MAKICLILFVFLQFGLAEASTVSITTTSGKRISFKPILLNSQEYAESVSINKSLNPNYKVNFLPGSMFFSIERKDIRQILQMTLPVIDYRGMILIPYQAFFKSLDNEKVVKVNYSNSSIQISNYPTLTRPEHNFVKQTMEKSNSHFPKRPTNLPRFKIQNSINRIEQALNEERIEEIEQSTNDDFKSKLYKISTSLDDEIYFYDFKIQHPKKENKKKNQYVTGPVKLKSEDKKVKFKQIIKIPTEDSPQPDVYSLPKNLIRRELDKSKGSEK